MRSCMTLCHNTITWVSLDACVLLLLTCKTHLNLIHVVLHNVSFLGILMVKTVTFLYNLECHKKFVSRDVLLFDIFDDLLKNIMFTMMSLLSRWFGIGIVQIKRVLWPRVTINRRVLIIWRPLLQLPRWLLYGLPLPLLPHKVGNFINLDVNNGFLHRDLDEDVYIKLPLVSDKRRRLEFTNSINTYMASYKYLDNCMQNSLSLSFMQTIESRLFTICQIGGNGWTDPRLLVFFSC